MTVPKFGFMTSIFSISESFTRQAFPQVVFSEHDGEDV